MLQLPWYIIKFSDISCQAQKSLFPRFFDECKPLEASQI